VVPISPHVPPSRDYSAMSKLTKRIVDQLQPTATDYTAWDTELRGFGCRVHRAGRKTFIFKYRVGGGRAATQRKMALGVYGPTTVDQARVLARQAHAEVIKGGDPAGRRYDHRRADSVKQFVERYLAEHARPKKSPRSSEEDEWLLNRYILPKLGTRKMIDLAAADVARVVHGLSATPALANRVRALLSKMLSLAVVWGVRNDPTNPARAVERYPERSRERYLSGEEIKRLGEALSAAERDASEPWQAIAAIRLLLFSGCRRGEILQMRWEYIDYDNGVVLLPVSKTGRKTIYLSAPLLQVLNGLPRKEGNPWLLPSRLAVNDRPFQGVGHVWLRLRASADLHDVRLHDLRHTFASKGVNLGIGLPLIGALLGHALPTTTAKYAHLAADPTRNAGERIASRIASELSGHHATVTCFVGAKRG
jgi:integrase